MASEVRHGPTPKFQTPLSRGRYGCTIQGRYTRTPGLTAVGVTSVRWNSRRREKRRAELLGMRSAFVCWFLLQWERLGGSWRAGVQELTAYPFRRLRRRILTARRQKKRIL